MSSEKSLYTVLHLNLIALLRTTNSIRQINTKVCHVILLKTRPVRGNAKYVEGEGKWGGCLKKLDCPVKYQTPGSHSPWQALNIL